MQISQNPIDYKIQSPNLNQKIRLIACLDCREVNAILYNQSYCPICESFNIKPISISDKEIKKFLSA